jgi:hypothetical protein
LLSLLETGVEAMKILVACEYSGRVREAFRALGHDAWSCDLEPAEDYQRYHLQEDVLNVIDWQDWDMMVAFPPCTYLAKSGARWLYPKGKVNKDRMQKLEDARNFFMELFNADIPKIAIENPTPMKVAELPEHSQVIEPYQFGDPYTKRTLLWLKGLPELAWTNVVTPRGDYATKFVKNPKDRSRTFQGIADAMATQWSNVVTLEKWI